MSLDAADRATIERWSGPVLDEPDVSSRLARLGAPEIVALEILQALRAEMMVTTARRNVGDEKYDHQPNMGWVITQIGRLVAAIAADDTIVLNAAAEKLVDIETDTQPQTRFVTMAIANPRRSG